MWYLYFVTLIKLKFWLIAEYLIGFIHIYAYVDSSPKRRSENFAFCKRKNKKCNFDWPLKCSFRLFLIMKYWFQIVSPKMDRVCSVRFYITTYLTVYHTALNNFYWNSKSYWFTFFEGMIMVLHGGYRIIISEWKQDNGWNIFYFQISWTYDKSTKTTECSTNIIFF